MLTTFGLAIWRGDEYILSFLFTNHQQSGLDFYYLAFVVIFINSNSIRLRLWAGRFSNAATSPSRERQFVKKPLPSNKYTHYVNYPNRV